ncbi:MAG: hypothetical protein ABI882_19825, partial [Acidobacteriota bacterium]
MQKLLFSVFIPLATLFLGFQLALPRLEKHFASQASRYSVQTRDELSNATPVQLGVLTDRQRAHSKLYAGYAELAQLGPSLVESAAIAKSEGVWTIGRYISECTAF